MSKAQKPNKIIDGGQRYVIRKHSEFSKYYDKHKENLPPTKNLDIGTTFFWWLQKNKNLTTAEKVKILYDLIVEEGYVVTYGELTHRPLSIDTKGVIPRVV